MRFLPEYGYLVENWNVLAIYPAVYLAVVAVLYSLQTSRFAVNVNGPLLKGVMMIYNAAQIAVCSYMFFGIAQNWDMEGDAESSVPDVIIGFFGWKQKFTKELEWFVFVHFLSKILDFFDTVFILLKRDFKRLSFLHVYHHASIILIWGWLLMTDQGNGSGAFGGAVNSFIHVLMYTHYLIRALGLNNPFKKMVTQAQLAQFFLCVTHASGCFGFGIPAWNLQLLLRAPTQHYDNFCFLHAAVQSLYQLSMIILFSKFYKKSYKNKNKDRHGVAVPARDKLKTG